MANSNKISPLPVQSAKGRIQYLLMVYKSRNDGAARSILLELLRKLPRYTRFFVYCTSELNRSELVAFLHRHKFKRFAIVPADATVAPQVKCLLFAPQPERDYTYWVRDPFLIRWDKTTQTAYLMETKSQKEADWNLAENLQTLPLGGPRLEVAGRTADIFLSGGNVLLDNGFILTGFEEAQQNWMANQSRSDWARQVRSLLSIAPDQSSDHLVVLGEEAAPYIPDYIDALLKFFPDANALEQQGVRRFSPLVFSHIDMFITPTGVLGKHNKPVLFLARGDVLLTLGYSHEKEQAVLESWNAYMDAIERELQDWFEVRRNPVPLFVQYKSAEKNRSKIQAARPEGVYPGAYNNCLVETTKKVRRVWLPRISIAPVYHLHREVLDRLDRENEALWKQLGFNVSFIEADFHEFLMDYSALHCITKELART